MNKNSIYNYVFRLEYCRKDDEDFILDKNNLTDEEIGEVLEIVDEVLAEGPIWGISEIGNADAFLVKVLEHASKHLPLQAKEANVINNISDWQEIYGDDDNPDMEVLIDEILCNSETRENILNEVVKGRYINLAYSIGLPFEEVLLSAMTDNFEELYSNIDWSMDDECLEKVLDVFRKYMNLQDLQMEPQIIAGKVVFEE